MVKSGDRWETEKEIADVYLNNMGAIYGMQGRWGDFQQGMFEAALQNVDAVVQPRQSNTWGLGGLPGLYCPDVLLYGDHRLDVRLRRQDESFCRIFKTLIANGTLMTGGF